MTTAFRENPKHPAFPMPTLQASRSSDVLGLPGHVPSINTPSLRPTTKVIKRLADPARHESVLNASPLRQSTRTTTSQNGTAVGQNPHLSPTAVQSSVRDTKHTSSSPGHAPLTIVQSGRATRKPVIQTNSRRAVDGFSLTNNVALCTENKNPGQASTRMGTSDTRAPNLAIRRPKVGAFRRQVTDGSPSSKANANHTHDPTVVRSPGVLGVSALNRRPINRECSRQPLATLMASASPAPRSGSNVIGGMFPTSLLGPNNSIARSVTAQIGSLFAGTVLSITGAWQSSLSFASSSENLIYKGLSFAGKHLTLVKKCLQLYNMRTCWPV